MQDQQFKPINRIDGYLPIEDHGLVGNGAMEKQQKEAFRPPTELRHSLDRPRAREGALMKFRDAVVAFSITPLLDRHHQRYVSSPSQTDPQLVSSNR